MVNMQCTRRTKLRLNIERTPLPAAVRGLRHGPCTCRLGCVLLARPRIPRLQALQRNIPRAASLGDTVVAAFDHEGAAAVRATAGDAAAAAAAAATAHSRRRCKRWRRRRRRRRIDSDDLGKEPLVAVLCPDERTDSVGAVGTKTGLDGILPALKNVQRS